MEIYFGLQPEARASLTMKSGSDYELWTLSIPMARLAPFTRDELVGLIEGIHDWGRSYSEHCRLACGAELSLDGPGAQELLSAALTSDLTAFAIVRDGELSGAAVGVEVLRAARGWSLVRLSPTADGLELLLSSLRPRLP